MQTNKVHNKNLKDWKKTWFMGQVNCYVFLEKNDYLNQCSEKDQKRSFLYHYWDGNACRIHRDYNKLKQSQRNFVLIWFHSHLQKTLGKKFWF